MTEKLWLVALFVGLVVASFLFLAKPETSQTKGHQMETLKIGVGFFQDITKFDPHMIQVTGQAELALNLYAPLVDYNDDGEIHGVIADSVEWTGAEFRFEIKKNLTTFSGHLIKPEDVYFSLKRIINQKKTTHGQLADFVCSDSSDPCDGLWHDTENLYIKPKNKKLRKFILPLLAAVDHGIIPLSAFGDRNDEYKITDYSETTGAYRVTSSKENGHMVWSRNQGSPRFNSESFETVETVPISQKGGIEEFNNKKIDLICMTTGLTQSDLGAITRDYSTFETDLIRLKVLSFLPGGMQKSSAEERATVGLMLKEEFFKSLSKDDYKPTSVFFPESEFGFLNDEASPAFDQSKIANKPVEELPRFKVAMTAAEVAEYKANESLNRVIDFVAYDSQIWNQPEEEWPDALFLDIDSLFHEDVSLLYYGFSFEIFGSKEMGPPWMKDYLKLEDHQRKAKLRELQNTFLKEARMTPVGLSPYIAVGSGELRYDLPKSMAGTLLWKIKAQ